MMTTGASLPADENEEFEAPIARVLKAAMLAEQAAGEPAAEPANAADEVEDAETARSVFEAAEEVEAEAVPQAAEEPEEPQAAGEMPEANEPAAEPDLPQEPQPEDAPQAPQTASPGEATPEAIAAWTDALHSVERSINEAAEAIRFLRATLQQMAPLLRSLGGLEEALHGFGEPPLRRAETRPFEDARPASSLQYGDEAAAETSPAPARRDRVAPIERQWPVQRRNATPPVKDRTSKWDEAESQWAPQAGPPRPVPKPVTLVPDDTPAPYAYKVTIEDRKGPVELLPLHRALTAIPSVRNVFLLNYVNGVASLSLETMEELQPPDLENAVKKVMKRSCSVVPHESNVILIQVGE
jgi:hypothetical protein